MRIFLIFILVGFISCRSDNETARVVFLENDLPSPLQLSGVKHDLNLDFVLNPKQVLIKNNTLIIAERKSVKDEKIHLFDLDTKKYNRSVGKDGLGPGEITMAYPLLDDGKEGSFWVYDKQQFKFSQFLFADTVKTASHQFKGLEVPYFITAVDWTSENTLIVNLVDGWSKYLEITTGGDTISSFGNWQDMVLDRDLPNGLKPEDFEANLIATVHQGVIRGNKSKTKFIKAGSSVDYVDIIDLKHRQIKTIFGPVDEFPELKISKSMGYQMPNYNINTLTSKYLDAFAGEESFFVLYLGKSYRQISEEIDLNRIFEIDYQGNILNHFHIDYPLMGFTVDEVNRKIYGVTIDEDPGIVEFDY